MVPPDSERVLRDTVVSISGFEAVAIGMSAVWIWVNAYHLVPAALALVSGALRRGSALKRGGQRGERRRGRRGRDRPEDSRGRVARPAGSASARSRPETSVDVFLPVYHEAGILQQALESIRRSDYPQDLLSLYVLTEPDDEETRRSLGPLREEYDFVELTVPAWYPGRQNKPRALNYAFERSDGDVVCIVDAEDIVSARLFREAVALLEAGDADYVQGRLDMVNEDDGWLNTVFRAEYGYWYSVILPSYHASGFPIPLGGTTCLLPRSVLEAISERRVEEYGHPWSGADRRAATGRGIEGLVPWDPLNVTEDFELGLLLWKEGYRAGYLADTPTAEESPITLDAWVRQRTRWEKGKMYTMLQYLRYPPRGVGAKVHFYTQSAVPHLGPVNILSLLVLLLGANVAGVRFHPLLQTLLYGIAALSLLTVALYGYGYWTVSDAPRRTRVRRTVVLLLTVPFYWLLQWIADFHAMYETYSGRFHWVKTTHLGRNTQSSERLERRLTLGNHTLSRRWRVGGLVAIVLGATLLRVWQFDSQSVPVTVLRSLYDSGVVTAGILYPTYVDLLLAASAVFPVAPLVLSITLSAVVIVLVYQLGVDLFDDRVGLVAALLVSVSSFHVNLGRTAAPYALVTVLAVGSWIAFLRVLNGSRVGAVTHLLVSLALVLTSPFGAFVSFAQGTYLLLAEPRGGSTHRIGLVVGGVSVLLTVVSVALVLARHLQPRRVRVDVDSPLSVALELSGEPALANDLPMHLLAVVVLSILMTAVLFSGIRIRYDGSRAAYEFDSLGSVAQVALLLTVPFVGTAAMAALTGLSSWTAAAAPASIGLALLAAKGITNVPAGVFRVGLLAFLVASSGTLVSGYYGTAADDQWGTVAHCFEDGDVVIVESERVAMALVSALEGWDGQVYVATDGPETTAGVRRLAQVESRVYLVQYQPSDGPSVAAAALGEVYDPTASTQRGGIRIVRYELPTVRETPTAQAVDGAATCVAN